MRAIKNYMRSKKTMRNCQEPVCATLNARKCMNEFCGCWAPVDNSFYFTGYTFTMPWTKKTWTMSRGAGYVSFADGSTKFHIVETGSAISASMVVNKDVIIESETDYIKLAMLAETIQDNIAQDGANARTEVSDDEKDIIVAGFTTLRNQQVWFDWDGVTYWKNRPAFPVWDVVDYDGKVLGQQWLLETWGKFAYLDGNDGDKFQDYQEALAQAWATKMKIDYDFSWVIREGFALNSRPSKWEVADDGYNCYVPTVNNYMYRLSFTNDGILQIIIAEAGQWIPGVEAWKQITLSNDAENYIAHNREGWIYIDAIGDEKVLWELAE